MIDLNVPENINIFSHLINLQNAVFELGILAVKAKIQSNRAVAQ